MAEQQDASEKQFEPTPRKLEDARKKGDLPRSADLHVAAAYAGFLLALSVAGGWSVSSLGSEMTALLANADRLAPNFLDDGSTQPVGWLLSGVAWASAPFLLIPGLAVILSAVAQNAFVVSPDKIVPKLSRISLLENAKNKFGRNGLFEFAKSASKLLIFSFLVGTYLLLRREEILGSVLLPPAAVGRMLGELATEFVLIVLVIAVVIGAIDFFWQFFEHRRRNMMSRKELTDEAKTSEGDPHLKQERRQRGYAIATNRMLQDVPDANVVIVNPTHYAVALRWDKLLDPAPVCVAKGVDDVARRIREAASEAGVPIRSDPPTARAIYATVEIGQEIEPQHYKAVAAAIKFAEDIRKRSTW